MSSVFTPFYILFRTTLVYLQTMFIPVYFIITNELVIIGFSFADPKKFNDFYEYLLDFHTIFIASVVLLFTFFPLLSKITKFKPFPIEGYRVNPFNIPQRTISIIAIISCTSFAKYKVFSVFLSFLALTVFLFLKSNNLIQAIISHLLGVLIYFVHLYFPKEFRYGTLALSLALSLIYILKIVKLNDYDPKLRNAFIENIIQNTGFIAFDILIYSANRTNEWIVISAIFANFVIHVIAKYAVINDWYGTKQQVTNAQQKKEK